MGDATLSISENRAVLQPFGAGALQVFVDSAMGAAARAVNAVPFMTWTALAAATGMSAGDRAQVHVSDSGTHTDPVVGGTVNNAGIYTYSVSPAGWQRIADLDSQAAATQASSASNSATAAANLVGLISPADILQIDTAVSLPKAPSWRTTANRLKRIGQCNWAKCAANEPRIYVGNSGAIEGVIFDGAETIKSADYFTAPANSSSPQWIAVNGTGGTVSQVGSHSQPDIAGGTGKLVSGTAGTATTQFRANNIAQSVVNGDTLRVAALVQFPVTGSSYQPRIGGFAVSGSAPVNQAVITVSATGVPTIAANGTLRAGVDLFDTDALGNNWYRVWCDLAVIATGTVSPFLQVPLSTGTYKFMLWSVKNPTQSIPSVVPVMGDASFSADGIQLGTNSAVEVEWSELCVGRTSVSDGLLTPPRFAHTPPLALEKRITVKVASEVTGIAYALPGPRQALLFPNSGAVSVVLGPGFWLASITGTNTMTSLSLVGAYADPKRWPILRRLRIFGSTLTTVNIDKLAFWLRTPVGSSVNLTDFTVSIEIDPAKITIGDLFAAGADADWSQYFTYPEGGRNTPYTRSRFGRIQFSAPVGGTYNFGRIKVVRSAGGMSVVATANTDLNVNGVGFAADQITMDGFFIGPSANSTGTVSVTLGHDARGDIEGTGESFWQTPYEIEVDIGGGAGWQTLTAAGVSATSLPKWRRFYNYGTHVNGVITASPKPEQTVYVPAYAYVSSTGVNKPGYQYNLSMVTVTDPDTGKLSYYAFYPGEGTVWVSETTGTLSAANPRIRIRHQASRWSSSSTVVTNNSNSLQAGAGVHGDHFQATNLSYNYSYNCQNVLFLGNGGQGFFQNNGAGAAVATSFNMRGILALEYGNGICIVSPGATVAGIMTRKESRFRSLLATGSPEISKIVTVAGTTIDATKLWVATISTATTGKIGAGTVNGPNVFAIARITNNTTVTSAAVDQPTVPIRNEHFFPPDMLENGQLASWVNPGNIKVTGYASEILGFDVPGLIKTCREGAWGMFSELEPLCVLDAPTHYTSVSNAAATGTALTLTPATPYGTTLKGGRITQGDPRRLFRIDNGVLKVNSALVDLYGAAMVDNMALVTDANERISVKVS